MEGLIALCVEKAAFAWQLEDSQAHLLPRHAADPSPGWHTVEARGPNGEETTCYYWVDG